MFEHGASAKFKKHAIGIIILGCITMYFSSCLVTDAMNVLQPIFVERYGWEYSKLSMPITIGGYVLIVLSFLYSTIMIKNGTRIFGIVNYISIAIGSLLIALSYDMGEKAYLYYFIGVFLSKLSTLAIQMMLFQLCASWFNKTRGRILGIVTMAAPLNSATSVTLMTLGNKTFGFKVTYIIIAVIMAATAVLTYFYAITDPREMGLTPDGIKDETQSENKNIEKPKLTTKEILTTPDTWKLIITFGLFSGTIGTIMGFFITRMTEVNVSTPTALTILSVASILGIPVSYLFGWIDDKFGTIIACRILGICYVLMMLCFYFGNKDNFFMIVGAAIGMAAMTGGTPNLHPSAIMRVFGAVEYQNANRYIALGISLISANGMQLMSRILDSTGSLDMGYIVFCILSVIATISIWTAKERQS